MSTYQHVNMSTCKHVSFLSTCQHTNMTTSHHVILSTCPYHVSLSSCQLVIMSTCQHVNILTCQHVNMSTCHLVILWSCYVQLYLCFRCLLSPGVHHSLCYLRLQLVSHRCFPLLPCSSRGRTHQESCSHFLFLDLFLSSLSQLKMFPSS